MSQPRKTPSRPRLTVRKETLRRYVVPAVAVAAAAALAGCNNPATLTLLTLL